MAWGKEREEKGRQIIDGEEGGRDKKDLLEASTI